MLTLYDEADFARTFLEVILPVQAETGSKLIGMSSPSAGGGSFTRVVFATDADGKKLMNSMILGAPCPLCRAGPHPEECEHNLEEIASWKDPKKMEKIKKVLIAVHAESIYRTELCAMANEGTSTLFARYLYEKLLSAPPTAVGAAAAGARASLVFGAVDPAGGGKSEFALTAIAQVPALKEYQVKVSSLSSSAPDGGGGGGRPWSAAICSAVSIGRLMSASSNSPPSSQRTSLSDGSFLSLYGVAKKSQRMLMADESMHAQARKHSRRNIITSIAALPSSYAVSSSPRVAIDRGR